MKFNDTQRGIFLDALRDTLNVSGSIRASGCCRSTVFTHRKDDPAFAQAWDEAFQEGLDLAEQSVNRRAFKGVLEDVYHQGDVVGQKRAYSDGLAMFMLKAHRPERFRDRMDLKVEGEISIAERIVKARKRVGGE